MMLLHDKLIPALSSRLSLAVPGALRHPADAWRADPGTIVGENNGSCGPVFKFSPEVALDNLRAAMLSR